MAQEPTAYHAPVLADEVAELFRPLPAGVVVDATFGGGGHARRLLEEMGDRTSILAIDRDPEALANAAGLGEGVVAVRGDFGELSGLLDEAGVEAPVGVLFDLGVSSHQLDSPRRGFSYRHDGPLDMRMGPATGRTAAEIVNEWAPSRLQEIIRRYGEERRADRIAAAIVAARPLSTTGQLAEVVAAATPAARRRSGHPARRTFQALRIAVNSELDSLERGLDQALDRLAPGGRCAVISYHSLEDRIVKRRFSRGARGCVCPPELPVCGCGRSAELRLLTRHPITPGDAEVAANRRARSARLRAAEKVDQ